MNTFVSAQVIHNIIKLSDYGVRYINFEIDGEPKRLIVKPEYKTEKTGEMTDFKVAYYELILPNMLHITVWFPYIPKYYRFAGETLLGSKIDYTIIDKIKFVVDKRSSLEEVEHYLSIIALTVEKE